VSPRGSTARQAGFTDPRSGARAPRPEREEIAGGEVVGGRIEPVIHVVRRKENFWTISRHYYGSGRFYRALWIANRDRVPKIDELYVGTPILVPAPEDLDKSYIDPPSTDGPRPVAGSRTTSSTDADGRGPRSAARRDDRAERTSRSVEADEEEERSRPQEEELSLPLSEPASRPGRIVPREPKVELTGERPTPRTRRVHVVQPYETLRSIARKELGDARREREILDINEDRIEDPRHLTPGLRLRIPEEETRRR
jgi:nucleoid-associated protein YgaU